MVGLGRCFLHGLSVSASLGTPESEVYKHGQTPRVLSFPRETLEDSALQLRHFTAFEPRARQAYPPSVSSPKCYHPL